MLENSTSATTTTPAGDSAISKDTFIYGTLLALILVVSSTVNIFTIVVFLKNRLLHTANNFLVVSLAVSDLLHVTFGCSIPLIIFITEWQCYLISSKRTCLILGFVTHVFYAASTNNLVLISFHRLVSIVFSQKKIIATMKAAKKAIIVTWIFTAISCLPGLFYSDIYVYNSVLKTCSVLGEIKSSQTFSTYSLIINFILPLLCMVFFYFNIYKMVLQHKLSTVSETILANGIIEKKSKRLIISVLVIFTLTWVPFYCTLSFSAYSNEHIPPKVTILVWPLKMSSSMSNPILYAVCNRLYFRCMLRLWKCQGELRSKTRQSPFSSPEHQSCCESSEEDEEVSTIGPLPEPPYGQCDHCMHCRETLQLRRNFPHMVSHSQQTQCYNSDLETVPECIDSGCKHSTCSHCTELSTSLSTQSSIPTIFQMPLRKTSGSGSSASTRVFGPTPDGQYYSDSGRSSFASQYGNTSGLHSARTSYSSNWPNSNRTSLNSTYAQFGSTPRGSTCAELDIKQMPSFSSRQSIYSSMSMPRSARSSVMSSRISHYAPSSSFSARSSLTSQYTAASTPFSTRPNTPQNVFVNTDVELVYIPPERESASTKKSSTTPSTRHSSDTTLASEKFTCRQIPDQMDIFEDDEPVSGTSSKKSQNSSLSHCTPDVTCQRVSEFLLGDIDPVEEIIENEIQDRTHERERKKRKSRAPRMARSYSNSPYRMSPTRYGRCRECSPQQFRRGKTASPCLLSPCSSPIKDRWQDDHQMTQSPTQDKFYRNDQPLINSVGKAVNLVVKARRMRSRIQPLVKPTKPDTPVPHHLTSEVKQKVPHVREPIRFVYETPYPCTYYAPYRPNQVVPTANTLRVPGRPPLLNVPQTIQEEEPPQEPVSPSPEVPSTPRRKNASSWLNPPVIDVSQGDDDMRVECPGVLVEHHN